MRCPHLFSITRCGVLSLAAASCWTPEPVKGGSSGGPPPGGSPMTDPAVVTSLDMTPSATIDNGSYLISGSISYTDDDDVVTAFEVQVPVLGKTYTFPAVQPYQSQAYGQPLSFTLSGDVPLTHAGPTNYYVILVNQSGAKSAPTMDTVDLQ
jgi:hypothetical protein